MHEPVVVRSLAVPTIRARCPGCTSHEIFESSGLFRANANGKVIDIWLIYRCRKCEATKNLTVVERTSVGRVAPEFLEAAKDNDAALARSIARDVTLIRGSGAQIAEPDRWTLTSKPAPHAPEVTLRLEEPLLVRLDEVIAATFSTSRTSLRLQLAEGAIDVSADRRLDRAQLWSGEVALRRRVP